MITQLIQTEYGLAVVLPRKVLQQLGARAGAEISVTIDAGRVIMTLGTPEERATQEFAGQVSEFIDYYREALEGLAK